MSKTKKLPVVQETSSNPARSVQEFFEMVDRGIEPLLKGYADEGNPVSCTTCTEPACCYQQTACWLVEALPIAERIIDEGRNTVEYRDSLKRVFEAMEGSEADAYFDQQIPCVFLKDKRCEVYAQRPITPCRSYFVVTPAERCRHDGTPSANTIVGKIDPSEIWDLTSQFVIHVHYGIGLRRQVEGEEPSRYPNPRRILMGSIPRMVWTWLSCYEDEGWKEFIKAQPWPTIDNLVDWRSGKNPYSEHGFHQ